MAAVAPSSVLQQHHFRRPSLGLPGTFELVESAEPTSAAQEAVEAQLLQQQTTVEQPLDWTDLVVVQPEQQDPASLLASAPASYDAVPVVSVAKAFANLESLQARARRLKDHKEVLQLVGTQARLIEELEADVETLRKALRQQSMEAADHINKAALAGSLVPVVAGGSAPPSCPDTPPSAPGGAPRAGGAARYSMMHKLLGGKSSDSCTDDESSSLQSDSEGADDSSSSLTDHSRQSSAAHLPAAKQEQQGDAVVCASEFVQHAAASPAKHMALDAAKHAVQPSAFAAAALLPYDADPWAATPKPQVVADKVRAPRRQLSAADVASFGSMGLTFSIAPSPPSSEGAPSVASMDADDDGCPVPCDPLDGGDEFLEPVGCLFRPWHSVSAPQQTMSAGSFTPFATTAAQLPPAASRPQHHRRRSEDVGRDVAPDALALRLASYRSVKESSPGRGAQGSGSWQVPVVVSQQRREAKPEDPLSGTLLGAVYKLFSA